MVDALPLGPAAGARGRRRLAQPRDRRPVRRVRRDPRRAVRRPGRALDPGQRAQRRDDDGLRDRRCTRPAATLMFDSMPVAHHLLLAHGRAAIALRAAGATSVGCANNHAPMWPASDDEADVGATKLFDALWNGMFSEPMLLGRYPADLAAAASRSIVQDGDMADDPAAARLLRRQLLQPVQDRRRRRGRGDAVRVPRAARLPDHRLRLAGRARRAARVADHDAGPLPGGAAADLHHRVRLRLQHGPGRARRRRRPAAHRLPRRAPAGGRHRRASAASTYAATTRGR